MFSIKQLVNKITDKGNGREVAGESSASFVETEEQHSAEGFLCPPCMRAFPSPEALEEHYNKTHNGESGVSNSLEFDGDIQGLRQEILNLQSSLAEERNTSEELKKEVLKVQAEFHSRDDDNASLRSQEKEFEDTKSLLTSEVTLLRQQLTDSLEQISYLKKEKEIIGQKMLGIASQDDIMKREISRLQAELLQRNSLDDAAVLRQELVSVQRMMDQITLAKVKEVEELNLKVDELESSLKNKDSDSSEVERITAALSEAEIKGQKFKEKSENLKKEIAKAHNEAADSKAAALHELADIKQELSNAEIKRQTTEKECEELKEEVRRLSDQHTELCSKIEGGEGAKAALEVLQKENDIIKQNLDSAQNQNRELSKNLHNLKIEVEKSQSEFKKLAEAHTAEVGEWEAKRLLYKEQVQRKESEMHHAIKKHDELSKALQAKDNELKVYKLLVEKEKGEVERATEEKLNILRLIEAELKRNLDDFEKKITMLSQDVNSRNSELEAVNCSNSTLTAKVNETIKELEKSINQKKEAESATKQLQEEIAQAEQLKQEDQENFKLQIETMENKLKIANDTASRSELELKELEKSFEETKTQLQENIEKLEIVGREKAIQIEALQRSMGEISLQFSEAEGKVQLLQVQTDEILAEKIELERKLKSSEEEKSLLLERCLSGESEAEQLQETIGELRRKLDDSLAALQELGRENQSLQMESAKLQGRKWADDSVVNMCTTCPKEFTLTIRKHHCRHCGQIFCAECSARTASVPSSKKPVRVCDACYQELTTK